MAYDETLADRLRDALSDRDVTERKMFGGLAFLLGGHMVMAASGEGGIMVRTDPATSDELVTTTPAEPVVMRGRPMAGWLRVATAEVADDEVLDQWVERALSYVSGLPPKR